MAITGFATDVGGPSSDWVKRFRKETKKSKTAWSPTLSRQEPENIQLPNHVRDVWLPEWLGKSQGKLASGKEEEQTSLQQNGQVQNQAIGCGEQ